MKINKLVLEGFTRLALNNVSRFEYTPTSPYQIILGRNGSGKSSLLSELTPLPASPENYAKGGSKTIELESRGSKYVLTSSFGRSGKHSFLKDGEELNPGGTATVQRELVKQEFRITPELHDLLIGHTRFTSMAPAKRREWITALSDTDLTYAIGVYNKLKSLGRDTVGAYKHVSGRLASETNKLLAIENARELEERAKGLREELTMLMENRTPGLPSYTQVRTTLENNLTLLEKYSREILEMNLTPPKSYGFSKEDDVAEVYNNLKARISASEHLLKNASEEHAEIEKLVEAIQSYSVESIDDLRRRCVELRDTIDRLSKTVKLFIIENPEDKITDTVEAMPVLAELLNTIEDNSNRYFNREELAKQREMVLEIQKELERSAARQNSYEHKVEHIKTAKETGCPKCGYIWRPGVSEGDLEVLQRAIRNETEMQEKLKAELTKSREYVERAERWAHQFRQFSNLVSNYPRLKILWDYLIENECLLNNPKAKSYLIGVWEADLEISRDIDRARRELERLETALNQERNGEDSKHLSKRLVKLEEEISHTTQELHRLREEANAVREYGRKIKRALELNRLAEQCALEIARERDTLVKIIRNEHIANTINREQGTLAVLEQKLTEKTTLEGILGDLQKSADALAIDSEAYKLLTECLSPNEGLIAEQLTGFISCLVEQMNEIIGHIWTYDLFVLPCGMESGDLDYKFPLQVRTPNNQVPDVSRASDGQKEIIDFAFKLVVMLYLDLVDFPLYLDELGRACDEQHRVNLMNYIKMIIDARRHSQLFYISHFATSHGAMAGAETLVLDGANISVPNNANENVVMN